MLEFVYTHGTAFDPIDITPCHFPAELNISNLPNELKVIAKQRLLDSPHYTKQKVRIDGIISYMESPPQSDWEKTIKFTNKLDQLRNESVLAVVPEFKQYWK
jgi:hypothetical protein